MRGTFRVEKDAKVRDRWRLSRDGKILDARLCSAKDIVKDMLSRGRETSPSGRYAWEVAAEGDDAVYALRDFRLEIEVKTFPFSEGRRNPWGIEEAGVWWRCGIDLLAYPTEEAAASGPSRILVGLDDRARREAEGAA